MIQQYGSGRRTANGVIRTEEVSSTVFTSYYYSYSSIKRKNADDLSSTATQLVHRSWSPAVHHLVVACPPCSSSSCPSIPHCTAVACPRSPPRWMLLCWSVDQSVFVCVVVEETAPFCPNGLYLEFRFLVSSADMHFFSTINVSTSSVTRLLGLVPSSAMYSYKRFAL